MKKPAPEPMTAEDIAEFRKLVCNPRKWRDKAFQLVCAANVLRADTMGRKALRGFARRGGLRGAAQSRTLYTDTGPMLVLYTYAVENLLKALIVARTDPVLPDGTLPQWFRGHNFVELTRRAQLTRDVLTAVLALKDRPKVKAEDLTVQRVAELSEFATSGKYPMGLSLMDGFRAHNYFPTDLLATFSKLIPFLAQELARATGIPYRGKVWTLCARKGA